jgi:hypothetical protein
MMSETPTGDGRRHFGPNDRLTPEDKARVRAYLDRQRKPKMLHIEVSEETFRKAKKRPEDIRVLTKDEHGNDHAERPRSGASVGVVGPVSEDDLIRRLGETKGRAEYERLRKEYMSRPRVPFQPTSDHVTPVPGGSAPDQQWRPQLCWDGVTRYRPDDGLRNEYVVSDYDIFAVLRRK